MNGNANLNANNLTPQNVIDWRNKLNIKSTITETFMSSDGSTWYRIWSDGWKECGLRFITETQGIKAFPVTFERQPTCVATLGRPASETIWGPGGNSGVVTINLASPYDSAYIWCGTSSSGTCCRLYCCGY